MEIPIMHFFAAYCHFHLLRHKFFGLHDLSKALISVFCPQQARQSLIPVHNNEQS